MPINIMYIISPPDYLAGKAVLFSNTSPVKLLESGGWCGHGESKYNVFDIQIENKKNFSLRLPILEEDQIYLPVLTAVLDSDFEFNIYDPRKHPSSIYSAEGLFEVDKLPLQTLFHCPKCNKERFYLSVGFEIPGDSVSSNDTSWFAAAVKCIDCHWEDLVYDHETA
jgi:hypothetical protein